jgi:filamentous hemagglutinin family protein
LFSEGKITMHRFVLCLGVASLGAISLATPVNAQAVIPDGTLNTTVTRSGNTFTIENGTRSGPNLFHSFREFSVPPGGTAVFNNATAVQTIFSRVTGGTPSTIDGILQANGTAHLFLLNPSGILFGPNAQLNIGGSFIGTTAQAIQFADGIEFSAANPTAPALLTLSVPIGLQMGRTPGAIRNASTVPSQTPSRFSVLPLPGGLQVQPNQSLVLLGGDISFVGGAASAVQGQIELGSVGANSFVTLVPHPFGFALNYDGVRAFQDVQLDNVAVLDARDGGIQVRGRHIQILRGSRLVTDLEQASSTRGIMLNATESLTVAGVFMPPDPTAWPISAALSSSTPWGSMGPGGLFMPWQGTGKAGDIVLRSPEIAIAEGATVSTAATGSSHGGTITMQASTLSVSKGGSIWTSASAQSQGGALSLQASTITVSDEGYVTTSADTFGRGGHITVQADQLQVLNTSQIGTLNYGVGQAGNLMIQARDVQASGVAPGTGRPTVMYTVTLGPGKGGDFTLHTERLRISDGGILTANTFDRGDAGNLVIRARDSVEITNANREIYSPTGLQADATQWAERPPTFVHRIEGKGGNIEVTTGRLLVQDGGIITVGNKGKGDAGDLVINAGSVTLRDGILDAEVKQGNQGNIRIRTDVLLMRDNSEITTNASSTANGGNISINAPIIVGLDNSDIVANAIAGRGGNIEITTQGIIGLQYRERQTPDSDITASSQFGINGTVQINNIGVDPNSELIQLATTPIDPSRLIADACAPEQESSFVISGRGGLPINPERETRHGRRTWQDLRPIADSRQARVVESAPVLVEATRWERAANGKIHLIADQPVPPTQGVTCAKP